MNLSDTGTNLPNRIRAVSTLSQGEHFLKDLLNCITAVAVFCFVLLFLLFLLFFVCLFVGVVVVLFLLTAVR